MQLFLRQLARPQAQADALRLQPVGEDFLALPDEAADDDDNMEEGETSDFMREQTSEDEAEDSDESLESKAEKNKLPYWLIITPEDSRINGPRVRLRFQRGRLTAEEARAVVMRAERSIAHLVRRVNQEILLWYVSSTAAARTALSFSTAHRCMCIAGHFTKRPTAQRFSSRRPKALRRKRSAAPGKTTSSFTSAKR
jgi:hypothetical protein